MIISISGLPGAGKSALAKAVADKLKWPCYSMGNLRRATAKEQGDFVIEGRTSWHFIPQSYKIFLTVDPQVGAQRIWYDLQQNNERNEDRDLQSVADVQASNQERIASDTRRYAKYFKIDAYDPANYDFVLETSNLSIEEMVEKVYRQIVLQLPA
ncbi:MAG: Cytidylate kinase [Candidatus Falkowbacteria bacterium GW2011_GWA2_39_24]|uniref:(d)CMP kinase n=1 Tax=Candidatus Falkowbacteria bacterium GW2011_GWA2_39_24 TaxID=1618634 RepID=A0A0G0NFH9_9BACT|nr:MAG: Cytidylate kinase [Candidatus Falkowbacteria bacterium GW2011_GWA2_39_24]